MRSRERWYVLDTIKCAIVFSSDKHEFAFGMKGRAHKSCVEFYVANHAVLVTHSIQFALD